MKGKAIAEVFKFIRKAFTSKLFLKLLSLLIALVIWAYIINTNPSLTRAKKVEGVDVSVSGTAALNNYGLALATDVYSEYENSVEVILDISQKEFYKATTDNVVVFADVSNIRSAGVHEVSLTATSATGTVKSIYPSTINVRIESMDSREVPVEVELIGTPLDNYWYSINESSVNPQHITITGPASVVQKTERIYAQVDVSGHAFTFSRAALLSAQDAKGENVNSRLLTRSSSTCSVSVDVYPTKEVPITCDVTQIKVADGFEIVDISFQPPVVTIAGDRAFLDSLDSLPVEVPSNDKPLEKTTLKRINIERLSEFKYLSSRQTLMTVTVRENEIEKTLTEVPINVFSVRKGFEAILPTETCAIHVKGPASQVNDIEDNDIFAYVDAVGLGEGVYELPIYIGNYSSLKFDKISPEYLRVIISAQLENDVEFGAEE